MKRFSVGLLLLITIPLLIGCFGGNDEENTDSGNAPQGGAKVRVVETSDFYIEIPFNWEIITPSDFTSDIPENALAAFRSNIKNAEFTANIAIITNALPSEVSSMDYMQSLLQRHKASVVNYAKLSQEEHEILLNEKTIPTLLVFFEGKEKAEESIKQFVQTAAVNETQAYIATGAYLSTEDEDTQKKIAVAMRSFRIK